jgi:DNA-binding transcriptional regulator YhcF (GntR family)
MVAFDIDQIFDAAAKIQLIHEKNLSISFSPAGISIKFPTTRRLAEYLDIPHYYVLPYFAMMEQGALVTRAERVGIMTTTKGTKKLVELMKEHYYSETEALLGATIFQELLRRVQEES